MWIFALTPIVTGGFPALAPLILAAAGAAGYKAVISMKEGGDINEALRQRLQEETTIQLRLDDVLLDSMEQDIARAESLHFEKDGITLAVIKDERNKLRIEVSAPKNYDKKLLQAEGEKFAAELAQLFAQNRAVEVVERMNAEVVGEEVTDEGEIRLSIRRWN